MGSRTAPLHIPVPTEVNERDGIIINGLRERNDQYYARRWICHGHADGMADRPIDDDSESCARPLPPLPKGDWRGIFRRARENGRERDAGRRWPWRRVAPDGRGIFVGANLAVTAAPPGLRSSPPARPICLSRFFSSLPFPRWVGWPPWLGAGARV